MIRLALLRSTAVLGLVVGGCAGDTKSAGHPSGGAPTATTGAAGTAGPRLRGADYALELAPGWSDTTANRTRTGGVDRVLSARRPRAVAVVVLRKAAVSLSTPAGLRARARREIAAAHATASTRPRPLTLDGESAITYQYRGTTHAGARIQARQVLVVHDRQLHVVTLVAARAPFAAADTALGSMLGTWRWADPVAAPAAR